MTVFRGRCIVKSNGDSSEELLTHDGYASPNGGRDARIRDAVGR